MDVVKVDRDVAMVVYVCCQLLFLMFHLFFRTYVASVFILMLHTYSHICCKYFYVVVAYILQVFFQVFFLQRFQMYVSSV
jgi:hypothetical protein